MIANWKMHPDTLRLAVKNFQKIKEHAKQYSDIQTVVCAPFIYLESLVHESSERIIVGAQDVFFEDSGAYTGEVSPTMLGDMGVRYAIIGHSERRSLGETDNDVAKKVVACIKNQLQPIVCVGEISRADDYGNIVASQVKNAVSLVPPEAFAQIIFAYEPLWAIGEKATRPATPAEIKEMKILIQKTLADIGGDYAKKVVIIYGGSTNADNARDFLIGGEVDGLLVGGASLDPEVFGKMLEQAHNL